MLLLPPPLLVDTVVPLIDLDSCLVKISVWIFFTLITVDWTVSIDPLDSNIFVASVVTLSVFWGGEQTCFFELPLYLTLPHILQNFLTSTLIPEQTWPFLGFPQILHKYTFFSNDLIFLIGGALAILFKVKEKQLVLFKWPAPLNKILSKNLIISTWSWVLDILVSQKY